MDSKQRQIFQILISFTFKQLWTFWVTTLATKALRRIHKAALLGAWQLSKGVRNWLIHDEHPAKLSRNSVWLIAYHCRSRATLWNGLYGFLTNACVAILGKRVYKLGLLVACAMDSPATLLWFKKNEFNEHWLEYIGSTQNVNLKLWLGNWTADLKLLRSHLTYRF